MALSANLVLADLLRARDRPEDPAKAEGVAAVVAAGLLIAFAPRYGGSLDVSLRLTLASVILLGRLRRARA